MLANIGPQQGTGNTLLKDRSGLIDLDRVRTTHDVSSVIFSQFALAPLVDVVADCVCAFRGTLFSWPALDLRPRLIGLHLAAVAT